MIRPMWMWIAVTLVAMTAGCRMGASPHDYSGPVLDGSPGGGYGDEGRAGSILSGMPAAVVHAEAQPDPAYHPSHQPTLAAPETQAGGPSFGIDPRMILSVTDSKVEPEPASQATSK